jgi:hypothetical protein
MKRRLTRALVGLLLLACASGDARAQVVRVRMKIDGYLCGN